VNWWLAQEYVESRFRLQDLPDTDVGNAASGPIEGRVFAVYYNQVRVGKLEIHPDNDYTTQSPEVYTSVELDSARFIGFYELTEFLSGIAMHVAAQVPALQNISYAMTRTLWDHYRISQYKLSDTDLDEGELNVNFQGAAEFYIRRKDSPAWQKRAAGSGKLASNTRAEAQKSPTTTSISMKGLAILLVALCLVALLFVLIGKLNI
jgi:hypothetical protein